MPAFTTREEYDLEIDLTLLRTEEGGKSSPGQTQKGDACKARKGACMTDKEDPWKRVRVKIYTA